MPQTHALIEALKRLLKARAVTYAELAQRIGVSEASVKRMFSQKQFTLQRLDQILDLGAESDKRSIAGMQLKDEPHIDFIGHNKGLPSVKCRSIMFRFIFYRSLYNKWTYSVNH